MYIIYTTLQHNTILKYEQLHLCYPLEIEPFIHFLVELNQCQCISMFPVAVHALGLAEEGSCDLEGELVVLKSVINVFTSCIANNGKRTGLVLVL